MRKKLLTFVVVLLGGVGFLAGPAAADRPSTAVESLVGDKSCAVRSSSP